MPRINFSPTTKRLIADQAGNRCSFPACARLTVGPGVTAKETSRTGTASHIYSAASKGPRGQGGLSPKELRSASNGIWLCAQHGRQVDNNRGEKYPPELLLFYKQLHEARVAKEHEGLYAPLGWIFDLVLNESPIYQRGSRISFSKLTLLIGENGTGKTAICEWLEGLFNQKKLERWRDPCSPWYVQFRYFVPNETVVGLTLSADNNLQYKINGNKYAFNPLKFHVVAPVDDSRVRMGYGEERDDDLQHLCRVFKLDADAIRVVAEKVSSFPHTHARNLRFVGEDGRNYLRLDLKGTHPGLTFASLSGREQETVLVEFATAIARESSAFTPTILILDSVVSIFFKGWFDYFSHHFLDPTNQFQTLMTIPTSSHLDMKQIEWNGWEVVHFEGRKPTVVIVRARD